MDAVEQKILAAVDAQRETLLAFAQDIGAHAEPGFFETRTAARVAELLRGCGLSPQTGLARTGVKAVLQGGAVLARRTMDGFTPVFTRESYIETVRRQG